MKKNLNQNQTKTQKVDRIKSIMIVGTTSNAGKSLVATAFCRYFRRLGINVAPYKAQNMALNSFVTEEGGEMGRAQVVQCEAARIKPHTDMNPVLLKPQDKYSSQLILNGKAIDNVTAEKYYNEKLDLKVQAWAAYDRLKNKFELIIMEGAGSPAEINILKYDFVNMAAAEYANAKTILVADIDHGGVFASIYGTIKLLPKKYQKLFSGIIINKFRGDIKQLEPGIKQIEQLTGIPVLGVLPYRSDIKIDEEDSVSIEENQRSIINPDLNILNIAIIKLPHISNYTDFIPFESHPQVYCHYVSTTDQLNETDLIIIPGTKSTCNDMMYLQKTGLARKIIEFNKKGTPIIGICGGYQILGEAILDPDNIEGNIKAINGLGLLKVKTKLMSSKELAQVEGITSEHFPFSTNNKYINFYGYEIHSGKSEDLYHHNRKPIRISKRQNTNVDEAAGSISNNRTVFGCYVHGIFDSSGFFNEIICFLANKKGINISKHVNIEKDGVYEQLADMIEKHIDLSKML